MHISETFFGDQAASRVDVTTKDRAGELGYKRKNMYVCMCVWEILACFEERECLSKGI